MVYVCVHIPPVLGCRDEPLGYADFQRLVATVFGVA